MKLHEDEGLFRDLIGYTAVKFNISEVYIEKDYWVTRILFLLSISEFRKCFIFKGGTALSKAYKLINRFSEDIDLAFLNINGLSGNQMKTRMKSAEKTITRGLEYIERSGQSKKGSFRKVYFDFPKIIEGDYGHASEVILLEMNCFTSPEPFSLMPVKTLIAEFIESTEKKELIEQYELKDFCVNVLDIKRTAAEKIIGLIKASRSEDPTYELSNKIRHFYDLCMIKRCDNHKYLFASKQLYELIQIVVAADREQFKDAGTWLDVPLHESTLFINPEKIWATIRSTFHNDFSGLVYDGISHLIPR